MAKTVAALFNSRTDAYSAVQELVDHGFRREDISVMAHDETHSDGPVTTDPGPSGLAQGAGVGAALGGIGAWSSG